MREKVKNLKYLSIYTKTLIGSGMCCAVCAMCYVILNNIQGQHEELKSDFPTTFLVILLIGF